MSKHSKSYSSEKEFREVIHILTQSYQKTHNIIRKDYLKLLEVTELNIQSKSSFSSLYRACIRELFCLIESDVYNLNRIDPYKGYEDKHRFFEKFKKTFRQVCETWGKSDLLEYYFSSKLQHLRNVKNVRDKITHPKSPNDFITPTEEDFNVVKQVFEDYTEFIKRLMTKFSIRISFPMK